MTDLTPNDLSHLSDEDFNSLCPQGEHAPGAEPLSPAAQAVLQAACNQRGLFNEEIVQRRHSIAAALRAAVDQVVPEPSDAAKALFSLATVQILCVIRDDFHAIATELENHG